MSQDNTPGALEENHLLPESGDGDLHEEPEEIELGDAQPESGPVARVSSNGSDGRKLSGLKWRASSRTVEETLAPGLSNEDLWLLIRRFNKQIYHVKAVPDAPVKELDLNRAEHERFPPEKLRMTLERFYTSVVVGLTNFFKHIGRLRSWKEPRRTGTFCGVYFLAWLLDILVPVIATMFITLTLFRPSRNYLFPPPPAPADDGSKDSLTGVPEKHKGEAAEQEANNLVNSVAGIAMESAAGKYGQGVVTDDAPETPERTASAAVPEGVEGAVITAPTEGQPGGNNGEDKTKKPMKKKVSHGMNHAMRIVSDITDIYERFANALSPTSPFHAISCRMQLVGIMVSLYLIAFVSSYFLVKLTGFVIGFAFFGDPIFEGTVDFLNRKVPDWKKHIDINRTMLKGVPTNAQLTLSLLRIGEIQGSPLPPPPATGDNDPQWPIPRKKSSAKTLTANGEPNNSSSTSLALQKGNSSTTSLAATATSPENKPKKRVWFTKLFKFVRRTISTAIKSRVAIDRAIALAGTSQASSMIKLLRDKGWISEPHGPLKFDAKFERKRGTAVIDSTKEPPLVYFTSTASGKIGDVAIEAQKKDSVLFQIPVTDICELKKTEGLGWKGKLIVELTAGSKDSADGLVIYGRGPETPQPEEREQGTEGQETQQGQGEEQTYHLTYMRGRNQLFNRLIAIDAQSWESH